MLGVDRFVGVFGAVPAGDNDPDTLVRIAVGAVRQGFAIVVDRPLSKIPMCTLTTRDAKKEDEAAQAASREAGNPRWQNVRHDCGLKHAITEDTDARRILKRLTKDDTRVNLGVELGASRMVVVDVDTDAENQAFLADWEANGGKPISMTVQSPGVQNEEGEWVHKNGGHYWFDIPEGVDLPAGTGAMKVEVEGVGTYTMMWAGRQVLVPPAIREEGPYRLVGQVNPFPGWLHDKIIMEVEARRVRAEERLKRVGTGDNEELDRWSMTMPWDEILRPDGWEPTGMPDGCSCLIWTAPGSHASPKSATAHDAGCSHYDTGEGHGPLHLWTDNPPSFLIGRGKTMTKLQYLAYRDHDGQIAPVLRDLGIGNNRTEFPSIGSGQPTMDGLTNEEMKPLESGFGSLGKATTSDPEDETNDGGGFGSLGKVGSSTSAITAEAITTYQETQPEQDPEVQRYLDLMAKMKTSAELESLEEPEPLIEGLLDLDTFSRITGKSNHGKSFVMLDMAACVALGRPWHGHEVRQGMVVYMVAEGARGWKKRLRAWEHRHNNGEYIPGDRLMVLDEPVQTADLGAWMAWRRVLKELNPVLVIMDTQARITVNVNENDAKEMGLFVERCEMIRRDTGACVAVVHHLGHNGDQGRGSSAVIGAINTELRVTKEKSVITVKVEKQKDEEFAEPLKFILEDEVYDQKKGYSSAVLVQSDGGHDPYNDFGRITSESSARDRMCAVLYATFNHGEGATRAELRTAMVSHKTLGSVSKTTLYETWNTLVQDGVLDQQLDDNNNLTQRFKLSDSEVRRLGLDGSVPPLDTDTDD